MSIFHSSRSVVSTNQMNSSKKQVFYGLIFLPKPYLFCKKGKLLNFIFYNGEGKERIDCFTIFSQNKLSYPLLLLTETQILKSYVIPHFSNKPEV